MTENRQTQGSWLLLFAFFALVAAAFVARSLLNAGSIPLFNDTDDAMRLVTVRDLLGGQDWFDTVQHRLNTPYGAELHWSRLVDLAIAGLILLLRPFAGAATETFVGFVWPLLLLFGLLLLTAILTTQLVGRRGRLAAVALPALSLITMAEFAPGRIDHHSIQILLLLGLLSCTLAALQRPLFAIMAGFLAATALAIGTESVPSVAAALMGFGLLRVFRPAHAGALRNFGLTFAAATLVHLAIALPPGRWLTPACDALSSVYATLALAVGLAYAALAQLKTGNLLLRGAGLAIAGGLVVLAMALLFPDCLRGPYGGLDPWLVDNWLSKISEAEPVWTRLLVDPGYTLAVLVPPLLALAIVALRVLRGDPSGRPAWLIYGLFLVLAVLVMLVQIRAGRFATSLAIPAGALAIVWLRERYLASRTLPDALGLVGGWLAFSGLAVLLITGGILSLIPSGASAPATGPAGISKSACLMPEAFVDLAGLPPERIMTPVDLGSHILAFTPHEVVAAPYHRNGQGVRDAFRFFNEPINSARIILDIRGIGLVVTCAGLPEMRGRPDAAPDSFVKLFASGTLPDWLVPHSPPDAPLQVYSIRR